MKNCESFLIKEELNTNVAC